MKTFTNKGCKIAVQKKFVFWQGSGGYTTRIRRLYKDQEVMFSDAIIEPLQKTLAYKGCKITVEKKLVFSANFALVAGFFGIGAIIRIGQKMLCLPYAGFLKAHMKYEFNLFH